MYVSFIEGVNDYMLCISLSFDIFCVRRYYVIHILIIRFGDTINVTNTRFIALINI